MQRNTSLLFVRCTTLLMISMCACSGSLQDVFSDHPHITISQTLCRMLCAISKFQPCAPSVGQMSLEQLKQRLALPVQCLQVTHRHIPLPAHHITFQTRSFDKYLCDLVAWGGTLKKGEFLSLDTALIFLLGKLSFFLKFWETFPNFGIRV
jgi:hypothetical protein